MPQIVMFWDEINVFDDATAGLRIEQNHQYIEIPEDACGFRLQRPGQDWTDHWHFANPGNPGQTFSFQGIQYSSSFAGSAEFVEARGPVGGCAGGSGSYVFVTSLGSFGITGDDPIAAGAGSFIADFTSESDIEWLNAAGQVIELEVPDPSVEPADLPPEFFEQPPEVKGCFRDFEGNLQCPEDTDSAGQAAGGAPSGGLALFIASNTLVVPGLVLAEDLTGPETPVASGQPVKIGCPAELIMTVRFVKSASAPAATVRYRFQFAHGPRSTVFEKHVSDAGLTTVIHSVPIPLPKPIGPTPGGGITPGADEFAVFRPPVDPIPTDPSVQLDNAGLTIEPLPDNEHKGSVRVEVINGADGIIVSGWASYHLVCEEGTGRPVVTPGLVGAGVVSLQANLNRWLEEKSRALVKLDGRFGEETTRAVIEFQKAAGLKPDGIVKRKTWRALLRAASKPAEPVRAPYGKVDEPA
jgi:hypothetical protein